MRPVPTRPLVGLFVVGAIALASVGAATSASERTPAATTPALGSAVAAARTGAITPAGERAPRAQTPRDRYEMAGGCYVVRSAASRRFVARTGGGFAATGRAGEPFHFQAFDLGKYLLFGSKSDFLATPGDPFQGGARPAVQTGEGYVRGTGDETLRDARKPVLTAADAAADASDAALDPVRSGAGGSGVVSAAKPSAAAEWVVKDVAPGWFVLQVAADDHDEANPGPLAPKIVGTLIATEAGGLEVVAGDHRDSAARFAFQLATGCAEFPEIRTNVTGPYPAGPTPYAETSGYVDAHLHMMAFEFLGGKARCGRPWHPYGVSYALVDCPDHEPGGRGAVLESVLSGGNPVEGHDTVGWPTFGYWPHYDSLTHEQVYYTWLERAWRGGLRMFTNLLVENGVLCELYPYKKNSCNEMDGVRLQAQRLHELERYIDAQSGGPGKGWFRIVTDPFEARRVINAGKLAVVMGIEVSVPFDCGEYLGQPRCTPQQIDQRLQEVYDLGVRQMELTNKFDNALTGVTGDDGATGVIVNNGNRYETGHYWKMQTCSDAFAKIGATDKTQYDLQDQAGQFADRDSIFAGVLEVFGGTGAAPIYDRGPHCNAIGLSDLGKHALDGLMRHGMVFDPDHMSASARKASLAYVEAHHYSGVVSSHSWADDPTYRHILEMGGVVTPHAGGAAGFVEKWRKLRSWADPRFTFGIGWGSDINGFSAQGAPRNPDEAHDVDYPFTALGGVTVNKQVSGKKTYDFNKSGVDHYGLYPDWVEDAAHVAGADGATFRADLARGVEAYLQMWERAIGVQPDACRSDVPDLTSGDLDGLHRGMSPEQVLARLGQPHQRQGSAFTYCVGRSTATVAFDGAGRLVRVG